MKRWDCCADRLTLFCGTSSAFFSFPRYRCFIPLICPLSPPMHPSFLPLGYFCDRLTARFSGRCTPSFLYPYCSACAPSPTFFVQPRLAGEFQRSRCAFLSNFFLLRMGEARYPVPDRLFVTWIQEACWILESWFILPVWGKRTPVRFQSCGCTVFNISRFYFTKNHIQ